MTIPRVNSARARHVARRIRFRLRHRRSLDAIGRVLANRLTYLGEDALMDLVEAVDAIERRRVPGVLIEAGAARGGSAIVIATAKAPSRELRVYDTFTTIPPPSNKDGADVHQRYQAIATGQATGIDGDEYYGYMPELLSCVRAQFVEHETGQSTANVSLIAGLFEDTLTGSEPVSLAHVDCDWYESVAVCLERITPRLTIGGRIVIDDYDHWSGCRRAVDDYVAQLDASRFTLERRARLQLVRTA